MRQEADDLRQGTDSGQGNTSRPFREVIRETSKGLQKASK